jgi:hypothetical protein
MEKREESLMKMVMELKIMLRKPNGNLTDLENQQFME